MALYTYDAHDLYVGSSTITLPAGSTVKINDHYGGDVIYEASWNTEMAIPVSVLITYYDAPEPDPEAIAGEKTINFVEELPSYTVTINVNNSSYGRVTRSSISARSGVTFAPSSSGTQMNFSNGSVSAAIPATATSSYEYAFDHWSPSSGTVSGDTTITAYFTRSARTYTCSLSYSANGGSGAPSTQTYTSSSTSNHTFTISSTTPTRTGYEFQGWATSSSATTASYQPGGTISVAYNDSITLYAVWKQRYTCYLYYFANGGSGAPSTQTYTSTSTSNHTFTISSTTPTRSGYRFLGWNTSSSATTANYQPGGTISVSYNGAASLYAIWEETPTTKTISLVKDGNYGTLKVNNSVVSSVTVPIESTFSSTASTSGGTLTFSDGTEVVATPNSSSGRYFYAFEDWSPYQGNSADYSSITATFVQHKQVTVYFDPNTNGEGYVTPVFKNYMTPCYYTDLPVPVWDSDHHFIGWYTDPTNGTIVGPGVLVPTENDTVTIYAHWELVARYTFAVDFEANTQDTVTNLPADWSTTSPSQSTQYHTIPSTAPSRSGYNFLGYAVNDPNGSVAFQPGDQVCITYNST